MKKNILLLAMLAATTTLGFTACSSDDEKEDNNKEVVLPEQPYKEDAVILQFTEENPVDYYIADENGETGYNVTELELTESGYYFVKLEKKRDQEAKATRANGAVEYFYLWGLYTKTADGGYDLAGFGYINIAVTTTGQTQVDMTIVTSAQGVTEVSVTVTVTPPPANNNSQENLNLCRAWDIVSTRVQIEGVSAFYQESGCDLNSILDYIKGYADVKDYLEPNQVIEKIVFSDNGTFSLLYKNENTDRAHWRWVNEATGQLAYDWEFGDMGYSFVDGTASVDLKPNGTTSQLKLYGKTDDGKGTKKAVTVTVNIK
jgi:hypothetical protein